MASSSASFSLGSFGLVCMRVPAVPVPVPVRYGAPSAFLSHVSVSALFTAPFSHRPHLCSLGRRLFLSQTVSSASNKKVGRDSPFVRFLALVVGARRSPAPKEKIEI